jgi:glycosyltransferase involved in cell wall biosynthesis
MDHLVPEISVITVVRNNLKGVELTFESLKVQTFTDWEMIVVDGASSDGTLDYLSEISQGDQRVKVYNQVGIGIYSAMNQGLELSNSNTVWFMNSGDRFFSEDSLELGVRTFKSNNLDLLIGDYCLDSQTKSHTGSTNTSRISKFDILFGRKGTCHQSMIFSKSSLVKVGGYSLNYQVASDYDAILGISRIGRAHRSQLMLSRIEGEGFSDRNLYPMYLEKFIIRRRHYSKNRSITVLNYIWTLAAITKFLMIRT